MRLHYISFFYFNIILFICFILRIDLFFLIFIIFRKNYSIFKESIIEYTFQEFDGLRKDNQTLDLSENKLYVDFGLDAGLEESYIQSIYMQYALSDISLDFEAYSGVFTFKWNDSNLEELNLSSCNDDNFKKIYYNIFLTNSYFYKNIKEKKIDLGISDDDYLNIYNYKNINRREIEEPLFNEDNEKYYYSYLKLYFLKENFYDTFINDNYIKNINYLNFIYNLKKKIIYNKKKKREDLKDFFFFPDLKDNMQQIKNDLIKDSFIKK